MDWSEGFLAMLDKLWSKKLIGRKHTPEDNCMKWIRHLSREEQRQIRDEWEYAIKQLRWIVRMKKTYENHVIANLVNNQTFARFASIANRRIMFEN